MLLSPRRWNKVTPEVILLEGGPAMLNRFELEQELARERRRNDLAQAERARLVAACERPAGVARWVARPLGRALFHLGARLLRYADPHPSSAGQPAYHRSSRAIE